MSVYSSIKGRAPTDLLITDTCQPGENVVLAGNCDGEREDSHGDVAFPDRVRKRVALVKSGVREHTEDEQHDEALQECYARENFVVYDRDNDRVREGDP